MQAVLISVNAKNCYNIAQLIKTIELRKTFPKLKTPFLVYIYCTKPKSYFRVGSGMYFSDDDLYRLPSGEVKYGSSIELMSYSPSEYSEDNFLNGTVIGEFVCDDLYSYGEDTPYGKYYMSESELADCCISSIELEEYAKGKDLYGWHISELKIYNTPKLLSEFFVVDKEAVRKCGYRGRITTNPVSTNKTLLLGTHICTKETEGDVCRGNCWKKSLTRAPQSWCYVEKHVSVNDFLKEVDVVKFINTMKQHNTKWVDDCFNCLVAGECNIIASAGRCSAWNNIKNKESVLRALKN